MQFLPAAVAWVVALSAILGARPERSEPVLVRAVLDGDTIVVATFGRVRLLGIDAPEIGRVFDTPAPFAYAARDRLAGLLLHRFVRLESDGERFDAYRRRLAYVVTEDGVCANVVLVREGLARVTARVRLARLDELRAAESEARSFRKGMWGSAPPGQSPGYTHRSPSATPSTPKKRRSSWPRSPSSTRRSARSANGTSSTTGSTTGRSGFSSSSSRRGR